MPEPRMTLDEATARLTAPGAPFEVVEEDVCGERIQVFKNRQRSLRDLLAASAQFGDAEPGDKPYVLFDDGRGLTFREHLDAVGSIAAALHETYGIGPGDRVAILGANSLEWLLTFWATISLDAIAVAMNGWWQDNEIRFGLELTEPKLLVVDTKRLERVNGGRASLDVPVVVMETEFAALWNHRLGEALPTVPIDEDDAAAILFTSGTTGRPKGAISTHRNLLSFTQMSFFSGARNALMYPPKPDASPRSPVNLCSSPMFHVSGLQSAIIAGIASGVKYVWTTGRFDPKKVLDLTIEHGVTRVGGITTQLWRILEHPDFDSYDLSHVTSSGGGGSVFSPELQRTIRTKIPTIEKGFSIGYGLTESGGLCTMANDDMLLAHPDCVGRALPTAQVEIFDDEGKPLPDGEVGHVCIRGPMVMPGYWNDPPATAEAFFPGHWLDSGDFGRMEDGLLFLATRKRDMIIRGGENVYPIEIENRLDEHPDVLEVAVVGVDHRTLGQEVMAIIVPRPGATIDPVEIKQFVGATLAYYKVPEHIEVRTEPLPRNATGKVMKHVLLGEAENTFVEE
ncbi:MAG TPA: class I adenylate-forming enzyme family protein [Acidimicrobiales bacterium]|jgi:acyl-CoA synthetase (AMP-forming)/AMP-acid ligase II|nr:class I adenylate-forming enzyme family protein [Acidimicrobiales bacterium]